jgi:hypothetical protein
MDSAGAVAKTLGSAPDASQANDLSPPSPSPSPSPEEGLRLILEFLRIERTDLRQEVFTYVAQMLRVQGAGRVDDLQ